ncbi:MAG: OB-fold domain-containing protein, partial [Candidatus Binatia bacterium]|nr:OB-fold domain-containing protein [Candidatus Binatia bacterium]
MRPLPERTPENEFFWTSGAEGVLRFQHCGPCERFVHPPQPGCPTCGGQLEVHDVSGRGTVVGFTVNHQQWLPDLAPPYVVALVAIDEDPLVRLTTLVVDTEPEAVEIGLPVETRFEQHEDIWLPLFTPTGEPARTVSEWPEPPRAPVATRVTAEKFESKVALTGVGISAVGRRLERDPLSLAADASRAAVADAGLDLTQIDGLSTYPGGAKGSGHSEGGVPAMAEALG